MTPEEAAQNLKMAVNPQADMRPTDALMQQLQQTQMMNVSRQQKLAEAKQAEIDKIASKGDKKDLTPWVMLADMFNPEANLAGKYAQLKKADPKSQVPGLQQQLMGYNKNAMAGTQALINNQRALGKQEDAFAMQGIKQDDKMAYLQKQYDLQKQLAGYKNGLSSGGSSMAAGLTKGEISADKKFGDDYQSWISGGYSNVQGNFQKLQGSIDKLMGKDELGGTILPEFIRARTNPNSVAIEQDVGNVVFQSLKQILGGQFTEKEGEKLVQQTYDSRLDDAANIKKLQSSVGVLKRMAEAKQAATKYFGQHGTLKGFAGTQATTMEEFNKELKGALLDGTGGNSGESEAQ